MPQIWPWWGNSTNLKSDHEPDKLITQTWAGKDTKSVFNECWCGSTSFVEMHHIRSVKEIGGQGYFRWI
uniref:Intron-encoded endonuclease aI1 n=1 Tax=Ophiocordycipitaceae sp. TaxID=1907519 RepID=A0A7S8CTZ5_9HYPO|nr:intron-encoded endonuclease aI1 [Ophiocordycipitaceae sp.]QUT09503.1 intron-encoded endonuclease aI1 [Ophiocordycipitaceae sp.]QUT09531.1 intron-encoded endonuclease aI1 [Ophiocordycipitaceae sp.]QUT13261.1 intron-encoded endonuclease aI1 [Ophiocordycipitaceae sp.]DAJ12179.1 TPA_asm: intron-encoded endonuclease aI1 [Ophiocordycipitaceae sp.]